jgi:hypothetical protein
MTPSLSKPGRSYVRWEGDLVLELVCAAQPLVKAGMDLVDALGELQQQYLIPQRQKPKEELERTAKSKQMREALQAYQRLGATAREALVERLAGRIEADTGPTHGNAIRWTDLEWALLRRRVQYWQRDMGDARPVVRLVYEAQRVELLYERWRTIESLSANGSSKDAGSVKSRLAATTPPGMLDDHPFDANQKRAPERAEPTPTPTPTVAPAAPPEASQAPSRTLREMVEQAAMLQVAIDASQDEPVIKPLEAPEPRQATTPPPQGPRKHGEAIRAFGEAFASGMADLMDAVSLHAVANMEERMRQISETLITKAMDRIDQRMQAMIKVSLEAALGGEMPVSDVQLDPLPDFKGDGLTDAIKMDVVGLFGPQVAEVKRKLNGYADAVRFIDINETKAWTPRPVVIVNTKVSARHVEEKCQRARVHVERVYGSSTAVLKAIEHVYEQRGIPLFKRH